MNQFDPLYDPGRIVYGSGIRRYIKTLTFAASGTLDLVFRRQQGANASNYQTYNSIEVDQEFNYMTIENLSSSRGAYCLETDLDDSITVDLTGNDTVKTIEPAGTSGSVIEENNILPAIRRLRVYLAGAGTVNVACYLK